MLTLNPSAVPVFLMLERRVFCLSVGLPVLVIACSEVTLDGIYAALDKSYPAGPKGDLKREDNKGYRAEAFLREWEI